MNRFAVWLRRRWAPGILLATALAVIGLHAGLIPAAHWQGDEFFGFYLVAQPGYGRIVLGRILGASPRLVAETLDWAYMQLASRARDPLIVPMLSVVWAGSLGLVWLTAWRTRQWRQGVFGMAMFAAILLARKPSEAFFWPVGALAYEIGIAAMLSATIALRQPPASRAGRVALLALLWLAAGSDEICALTVMVWGMAMLARRLLARRFAARGDGWLGLAAMLPGLIALPLVWIDRMAVADQVFDRSSRIAGSIAASLGASWTLAARVVLVQPMQGALSAAGLAAGAALVAALPFVLSAERRPQADRFPILAWAAALCVGGFVSIVMALLAFGTYCCERHASLQFAFLLMALSGLGALVAIGGRSAKALAASALLLLGLGLRAPALRHDYALLPAVEAGRRQLWSALNGGATSVTIEVLPQGQVVNRDALSEGDFHAGDPDTPWDAMGIMRRFGLRHLHVARVDPSQP